MISRILEIGVQKYPTKQAILYYDHAYTYKELDELTGRLSNGLREQFHLGPGDVLALQSTNCMEFVLILLASWRIGVAVTPLNPALKPEEIKYQLENSQAKCFIFEGGCLDKAREAISLINSPIKTVMFRGTEPNDQEQSFDTLFTSKIEPMRDFPGETIALIIYTSGTTGKPKGVLLTHHNVTIMAKMLIDHLQITEFDRSFLTLPLFHVNAILCTLCVPLFQAASVVLRNRFVLDEFLPSIDRYKPTYMSAVPTVYKMLADLPDEQIRLYDLTSLRFGICGGAPISLSEFNRFETKYPFKLIEGWGLSEGTMASTLNPLHGLRKAGSIGLPLSGQEVRVVNEEGVELAPFEKGELIVRGENVMKGYLNNPIATKETIRDGWLYTGDIGYKDGDGYLYIVGRKKDMIIRGGMNIYPKQIEEVLYEISDVREAAVIGIPDEKYGEEVIAYVSLQPHSTIQEKDILAYCQEKLANYKCPKKVLFLDSLPKNSVGKIVKGELKKLYGLQS